MSESEWEENLCRCETGEEGKQTMGDGDRKEKVNRRKKLSWSQRSSFNYLFLKNVRIES